MIIRILLILSISFLGCTQYGNIEKTRIANLGIKEVKYINKDDGTTHSISSYDTDGKMINLINILSDSVKLIWEYGDNEEYKRSYYLTNDSIIEREFLYEYKYNNKKQVQEIITKDNSGKIVEKIAFKYAAKKMISSYYDSNGSLNINEFVLKDKNNNSIYELRTNELGDTFSVTKNLYNKLTYLEKKVIINYKYNFIIIQESFYDDDGLIIEIKIKDSKGVEEVLIPEYKFYN